MTIKRIIEAEIKLTPYELADEFWNLTGDDQAEFFNRLGYIAKHMLPLQLQSVQDSKALCWDGRHAMRYIGDYSDMKIGEQE